MRTLGIVSGFLLLPREEYPLVRVAGDHGREADPPGAFSRDRGGMTKSATPAKKTPATDTTVPRSRGWARFFAAALRHPGLVGAIAPSSQALARRMSAHVPTSGTPTVVELGAGTGVFTRELRSRVPSAGRVIAVERDAGLAAHVEATCPGADVVHGDAARLRELLACRDVSTVDAVVCGLPWSLLPEADQRAVLGEVAGVLAEEASFTTFAYAHATAIAGARRFRAVLGETFAQVRAEPVVWRNVPPALTYVAREPVAGGPVATAG